MNPEEKYPLLIGHSLAGRTRLDNIYEVANFICTHGQYSDLLITEKDGTFSSTLLESTSTELPIWITVRNC